MLWLQFLPKTGQRKDLLYFPGSMLEIKSTIDKIFADETSKLMETKHMKNIFKNINICAIVKNKNPYYESKKA